MDEGRPFFRFLPRAYEICFEVSTEPCGVCAMPCEWRYTSLVYTAHDAPKVCARCIADGRLGAFLSDQHFQMNDMSLEDGASEFEDEVLRRTPGFSTFNAFTWPVIGGKPAAFLGYGDEDEIWRMPDAKAAIVSTFREELDEDVGGPTGYALVFRELDGTRFRVVIDLD